MGKFSSLDPNEAKKIETAALDPYFSEKQAKSENQSSLSAKDQPLLVIKSIFPFQLFPDELDVYRDKVTLINRLGPGMEKIRHLHLHEIAQLEADCGPIFGHLHIIPKLRTEETMLIDRLSRKNALAARDFIENLLDRPLEIKESTF
jgi:hypothetical protein